MARPADHDVAASNGGPTPFCWLTLHAACRSVAVGMTSVDGTGLARLAEDLNKPLFSWVALRRRDNPPYCPKSMEANGVGLDR